MNPPKPKAVAAVGPRLRRVLTCVFILLALLAVNSLYLAAVTFAEWLTGRVYQDWFYLYAFLGHLLLGLAIVVPSAIFIYVHTRNTWQRKGRRAIPAGIALVVALVILLGSGLVLVRIEGLIDVRDATVRSTAYWLHVLSPLVAAWLFILHRLAGPRIRWGVGLRWGLVGLAAAGATLAIQAQDPRAWGQVGSAEGLRYFEPSLARTMTGAFIPAPRLMDDAYCQECHEDVHATWTRSAHRFSSFNNPAYLFSVRETRKVSMERDGTVRASRFCAGCHDPVPFFSGRFDDPAFDDVHDPTSQSGITCSVCHSITNVNSTRGNADFTIDEPMHYPFVASNNPALAWINRQLIKSKPAFHKKTFLKPLHKTTEFCGSCHKVHLPKELNTYKWLRGQNHYDSFWLSGVAGHGVASFYYPKVAQANCNGCHMGLFASNDFGAALRDDSGEAKVHDHQFPAANTALPALVQMPEPEKALEAHRKFTQGTVRVDLFGLREEGRLDGRLVAPLRPALPALEPGRKYLLEVVVRTLKVGHHLTQGTADSNELWLDLTAQTDTGRVLGRSGARDARGEVDPFAHFVNAYVLDRQGRRIDRRNAQDIFVPLYDNQIPPGAADVVHYELDVPADAAGQLTVEVVLRYRKFDATYMRHVFGEAYVNTLPVIDVASDRVVLPIGAAPAPAPAESAIPAWERWNDYGIGLLRKARGRQLRQAEEAFATVEKLGRVDGAMNLARVYLQEGRVQQEAPAALARALTFREPAAPPWTHLWLSALVDKENGRYAEAGGRLKDLVQGGFDAAQGRGFDFSKDYRMLAELGQVTWLHALATPEGPERTARLREAAGWYERVLALDAEDLQAHWGLKLVHEALGETEKAAEHEAAHARYKPDDNARDVAVAAARRHPPADHAAEPVVIYDLGGTQ